MPKPKAGAQPEPKAEEKAGTEEKERKPTGTETKQPVPTLFTASISASYSRKFSLDTTVHSEITVTMKPYPPPEAFLNAVRAHYEKTGTQSAESTTTPVQNSKTK